MRVFLTGATGFVGSAIIPELLSAGHEVLGLARSEAAAQTVATAGATPHPGSLDDLESLRRGAESAEGVIHCGFIHDFANFAESCATDRRAVETFGEVLAGSRRPLIVTSGIGLLKQGRVGTEEDEADASSAAAMRVPSETATLAQAERGVRAVIMRLPPTVHGQGDHGFVPTLIQIAREKGVSGYPSEGANRWPAVHRRDAARLYRLALESALAGTKVHAVAEEGLPTREIAEAIGAKLGLPVRSIPADEVKSHYAWLGHFFAMDVPASSQLTRARLGWAPKEPGLLEDMAAAYFG